MIFVNFDHVTYFDAENSEFLQYRFLATVKSHDRVKRPN